MEIKHLFNREILAVSNSELSEIFVVKSGRLVLVDHNDNKIASYGPSETFGLNEVIFKKPVDGNLHAKGTTSVLALGAKIVSDELEQIDPETKALLCGVLAMVVKHQA